MEASNTTAKQKYLISVCMRSAQSDELVNVRRRLLGVAAVVIRLRKWLSIESAMAKLRNEADRTEDASRCDNIREK